MDAAPHDAPAPSGSRAADKRPPPARNTRAAAAAAASGARCNSAALDIPLSNQARARGLHTSHPGIASEAVALPPSKEVSRSLSPSASPSRQSAFVAAPPFALRSVVSALGQATTGAEGADITCFLRTSVSDQPPRTPKVKQVEALLMSPTRRTAKKAHIWQCDYGGASAAGHAAPQARTRGFSLLKEALAPESPTAAAVAAVGALQMHTPVAVSAGLLGDASDRT
ncbi:hypothetical protein TSOC_005827 [Tetrabaena socialis]|uniref:Uncharacterized protein n=1 Tax=Tetrabaena socialis TaxID=47790 RepID=A0A2J8A5B0_9CHLO|nr:hypothetical protein TSOC_005827 [Tetrabaena socialis]|eukprot:PNH07683.1 hypothetical protein TSOC_005827 [Tetrabaena socialis]